ncbi:MAG: patatin-like phospholipase family protein, partial [Sulfuricella sp.]
MTAQTETDSIPLEEDRAEFERVLQEELNLLGELRDGELGAQQGAPADSVYQRARAMNLAGLAFSGGGIRSATFNLGVIQALSRFGLLSKFDYLSTVSGGGYIGGWLSALLHRKAAKTEGEFRTVGRKNVEAFQACLQTHPDDDCICGQTDKTVGFSPVEDLSVRYLRCYSNYLSPKLGLSGDMLAAASIFLRNFTLIQLSLISLVATVLLFAHAVAVGSAVFIKDAPWVAAMLEKSAAFLGLVLPHWLGDLLSSAWPFVGGALALMFSVWSAGRLLAERGLHYDKPASASRAVSVRVVLPSLVAAWWLSAAAVVRTSEMPLGDGDGIGAAWPWLLAGAAGYLLAWGLGYTAARRGKRAPGPGDAQGANCEASCTVLALSAAVSGALLGLLLFAAACYVKKFAGVAPIDIWHAVAFGPPLFLLGLSFVVTVHIGAVGRSFSEDEREWFARLGG